MSHPASPSAATDELVFHDYHVPPMRSGDYTITTTHELGARTKQRPAPFRGMKPTPASAVDQISGSADLTVRVAGPQLRLDPGLVSATFPANMASGEFARVLPHVTLTRSTLPWERLPHGKIKKIAPDHVAPWLVLLIVDEHELPTKALRTVKVNSAAMKNLPHEDTHGDDDVSLLFLDRDLVASQFPLLQDLSWLSHVRTVRPAAGAAQPETATVLASRLPTPGLQNHAYLVSVEGRYPSPGAASKTAITLPGSGEPEPFPVLYHWTFFCETDPTHELVELLTRVQADDGTTVPNQPLPFALDASTVPADAAARVASGMVPVRHELRNGDVSAAWFHGPLLPGRVPVKTATVRAMLPADHGDNLLIIDDDFAMCDVSYASAWELGRMLVMQQRDIANDIFSWKRSFARWSERSGSNAGIAPLHKTQRFEPMPALPAHVEQWIQQSIMELQAVPFRYLVPDQALLPSGALRFFDIDPGWIDCLRDGVFSVGRTDSKARDHDRTLRSQLPEPPKMSGFLLRSSAVADFPHLEFDGYAALPKGDLFSSDPLPVLRAERLSPSVLLVILAGRVRCVDLHLHPQAVHFGFEITDSTVGHEVYQKVKRHPRPLAGAAASTPIDLGPGTATAMMTKDRRIDIAALAAALGSSRSIGGGGVADFALQMLDGVPLVRFKRTLGAAT